MKVEPYNFFFHPLNSEHSSSIKMLSIITNVALSVLSLGIYVLLFGMVHLKERAWSHQLSHQEKVHSDFVGIEALKEKQKDHLKKLEKLAEQNQWIHIQDHTNHPDSGFDWWMFPIKRSSSQQGYRYSVTDGDIQALKADPEFIENYRKGVILVAKSWGWDLEKNLDITNDMQRWVGYDVRLGKILDSLRLFEQKDLHARLSNFVKKSGIPLQSWVKETLNNSEISD